MSICLALSCLCVCVCVLQVAVWEEERFVEPDLYKTLQSLYTQTQYRQQQVSLPFLTVNKSEKCRGSAVKRTERLTL